MRKFIKNIQIFITLLFICYFIVSFSLPDKDVIGNDYMAGIIVKHHRLDSIKSKKIIFAGGSNLAFGLNSTEIENEFKLPVVNLGLHAGLGLSFILEELKQKANAGDVVFLSIEYMLKREGDYKLKKLTRSFYPEAINYYSVNYFNDINLHIEKTKDNIKNLLDKKKRTINRDAAKTGDIVYSKKAFDAHGDVISHLSKKRPEDLSNRGIMKYKYWDGIKKLNEFKDYADSKNIQVFFLYPNYPISEFKKNHKVITKYAHDISKELKIVILNTPSDFVLNDTLFFDTTYHLTKDGREQRTKKLIHLMKSKQILQNIF